MLKRTTLGLLLLFLWTASLAAPVPKRTGNDAEDVKNALLQNARGFETGVFDLVDSVWSHGADVMVFEGGHANYGWDDYRDHHRKPEMAEMKNVEYRLDDIHEHIAGTTAWATFSYTIAADIKERHVEGQGLGTAVLEKRSDGWKIVHWHSSSGRRPPASIDALVSALRKAGFDVKKASEIRQPFFSVPAQVFTVEGEELQLYQFGDAAIASREASKIAPSGSPIGTSMVTWMAPPHIFRKEALIAIYIGRNPRVRDALVSALGAQIAGAPQ
ncbi:MAG TPA: nuclear transport factor 2 family protein [Thermoanaerobaculia bacterium]|nr:nuclear transport factor 2 family protein [Thermoanaerobaculia bacterium]